MRLTLVTLIVAMVGTIVAGASGAAGGRTFGASALMTPSQVVPKLTVKAPSATGHFSATLTKTPKGYTMHWRLTYSRLTGPLAWTYIHKAPVGAHGPAIYILCQQCASGKTGSLYISPWAFNLMHTGKMYVTIRTKANPAGEVRGQIKIG